MIVSFTTSLVGNITIIAVERHLPTTNCIISNSLFMLISGHVTTIVPLWQS